MFINRVYSNVHRRAGLEHRATTVISNRRMNIPRSQNDAPLTNNSNETDVETSGMKSDAQRDTMQQQRKNKREAESTDPISTFLTRRFGLAGGLAWLGFLAVGSLGEQLKTRSEVDEAKRTTKDVEAPKEIVTDEGLRITDLRIGGGIQPPPGDLVVVDFVGRYNGRIFEDTRSSGKPLVFLFGRSSRAASSLCEGAIKALGTMKAGGKRNVKVPPALGFKDSGYRGSLGVQVPAGEELEYEIELIRVSIPPS